MEIRQIPFLSTRSFVLGYGTLLLPLPSPGTRDRRPIGTSGVGTQQMELTIIF